MALDVGCEIRLDFMEGFLFSYHSLFRFIVAQGLAKRYMLALAPRSCLGKERNVRDGFVSTVRQGEWTTSIVGGIVYTTTFGIAYR